MAWQTVPAAISLLKIVYQDDCPTSQFSVVRKKSTAKVRTTPTHYGQLYRYAALFLIQTTPGFVSVCIQSQRKTILQLSSSGNRKELLNECKATKSVITSGTFVKCMRRLTLAL